MEMEIEDEINLLDYLQVIIKRWKIIAWIVGISVVSMAIISLLMTPIYQAKTTIMPVESSGGQLSGLLQNIGSLPFVGSMASNIGGGGTSANKLVAILNSRTLAEDIIKTLDLMKVFSKGKKEPPTLQDSVKSLTDITKITDDKKKGVISISVEYKDPKIAADIANHYTTVLQKFINENTLSMAKKNRIFLEAQLKKVKEELRQAEENMKSFQTKTKIVAADAQAEAVIHELAELKAQITVREVRLGVMKQFSTAVNPDVLRIRDELRELRKQLAMMDSKGGTPETMALPSLSEAPTLGLQYIRLKRDTLIQEKVFELLTQQYEIAKVEEAKDGITFQVIDRAIPPEKRIRPKRTLIVMLAGVTSLFAGVFLVFFLEYLNNIKQPKEEDGVEI
ncbi:MAG: Wzz/FepE/Etk N-terminal domain-containing protein [Pseudomonadota bacterium]